MRSAVFTRTNSARRVAIRLVLPTILAAALSPAMAQNKILDSRILAPYVPTPEKIVSEMLGMAKIQASDIVYDLGSGDGRIVIAAAEQFGARAVGIELDEALAADTRQRVADLKLSDRVSIVAADMRDADLSEATIVTMYLMTSSNALMKPKFESELKPGTRVLSYHFEIRGWEPVETREVLGEGKLHKIYLYVVGEHE